jgi:hypothetical protein
MKSLMPLLALTLLTFVTGCVILPHGELVAPPASGQVLDSDGLRPVAQAKVVRRIEAFDRVHVTLTVGHGAFELKKDTDLRWLPFVCYATTSIEYRIEAAGYRTFMTNLYGGGSFGHGHLPHELGRILIQKVQE